MSNFIHLILTRFNVPTEKWTTTKNGKPPLTEVWMEDRFQLFINICLPSFKKQSSKNFVWLVFFDKNTPEKFKKLIQEIEAEFPVFRPVFVNDFTEMKEKVLEITPSYYQPETEFVISAEIDNDDVLHKDYIKISQELYKPIHNLVLDLRKGYQMSLLGNKKIIVNEYYVIANPFVVIIEKTEEFKSILKGNHRFYRDYKDVIAYDALPLFIQTIHGNNLMNGVYQTKYLSSPDLPSFGIKNLKINQSLTFQKNIQHYWRVLKHLIKKDKL